MLSRSGQRARLIRAGVPALGVVTGVAANESALNVENAGYQRSLQFLDLLQTEVGSGTIRLVNAALASSGTIADSKRFLDLLEKVSGKRVDNLFAEWVFPPTMEPVLTKRRQGQQALQDLLTQAADKNLSDSLPERVQAHMDAWRFDDAIAASNEAKLELPGYDGLKQAVSDLTLSAEGQGLSLPASISEAIHDWQFARGRRMLADAQRAIDAYSSSREQVDAKRGVWKRLALVGADPHTDLTRASEAFSRGDFQSAMGHANQAAEKAQDASGMAFRKMLVLALVCAVCAGGIAGAVWTSRKRYDESSAL